MKRELFTDYLVMVCEGHDFITSFNHVMKVVKNDEKRYILHKFNIRGIGTLTT